MARQLVMHSGKVMKRREQIYTIASLIFGLLNFLVVAEILIVFPSGDTAINHFMAAVFVLVGIVLVATNIVNLACKTLTFVGTVVQIAFLILLFPLGTAFAIWGIWLMRKANTNPPPLPIRS